MASSPSLRPDDGRRARVRRRTIGGVAGVVTAVLVAVPVFWAFVFAVASWTGCFIECGTPDRGDAIAWGGFAVALLALPFGVARLAAGATTRSRRSWLLLGVAAVTVLVGVRLLARVV